MRRIGLFPGTFDPIHDGHIEVARAALEQLDLDELLFLIEKEPWGDKQPVDLSNREDMVNLAIKDELKMSLAKGIGDHFTISETLPRIDQQFPDDELYFIFGADIFLHMSPEQWPGLEQLFEHYIVVFERGVLTEKKISEHARILGIAIAIIPSTHPQHSSTDVRLEAHNKAVWVPKPIADYIQKQKLY